MKSPHASEMDTQFNLLKGMLVEFGLTPAARSRMRVEIDAKSQGGIVAVIHAA